MFLIFLTAVIYTDCLYGLLVPVVIPSDNVLVEVLSLLYKVEPIYYTGCSGEDMAEVEWWYDLVVVRTVFAIECSKLKLDVLTTVLLLPLVSGYSYENYLSFLLSVRMLSLEGLPGFIEVAVVMGTTLRVCRTYLIQLGLLSPCCMA